VQVQLADGRQLRLPESLAAGLHRGAVLGEEQIRSLEARGQQERGFQHALQLLARRPRSEAEIRQRLRKRELPAEVQEAVIGRLAQLGYLDDEAFARAWVENRLAFRPRGRSMLRYELRQKGVSEETIQKALADFDEERALQLAAHKGARKYRGQAWQTFRQRLTGYLARRGFPYAIIPSAVRRAWEATVGAQEESEE
jgi:regulatory protein